MNLWSGETGLQGETGMQGDTGIFGFTGMSFSQTGMGFWTGRNERPEYRPEELSNFQTSENSIRQIPIPEKLRCEACQGEKVDENGETCQTCKGTGRKNMKMKWLNK